MSSSPSTEQPGDLLDAVLDAASTGTLSAWRPLPDGATEADLLDRRPQLLPIPVRQVLGQPATGYRLEATAAAPVGVLVWAQHGEITLVQVDGPASIGNPVEALGPPDATLDSGLAADAEQLLWPARGLILHRARATLRVIRLYGHHASTVAALERAPVTRVRIERHPLR